MRVKICGINKYEFAKEAIELGVDAVGFLVGITHKAEDKITFDEAKDIISKLPPFVSKIMVTHLIDPDEIVKWFKYIGADTIQLHDEVSIDSVVKIKKEVPYVKLIKSVSVIGEESVAYAKSYENYVDAILLDSRTKDRIGGTGITHDWNISKIIVETLNIPVILAGGLKPENLDEAIKKVQPWAVDVNSGVENQDGSKNYEYMKKFINIAKAN